MVVQLALNNFEGNICRAHFCKSIVLAAKLVEVGLGRSVKLGVALAARGHTIASTAICPTHPAAVKVVIDEIITTVSVGVNDVVQGVATRSFNRIGRNTVNLAGVRRGCRGWRRRGRGRGGEWA